ncbi:MAG: hypothetical protein M3O02_09245 [Acidobacteriota bacterium]|nr:hypothetical protein [Acidobacteriota bacterium]
MIAAIALFFTWFTFLLIQYDRMRISGPGLAAWIQAKLAGTLSEGDQYRIALPLLMRFLEQHAHIKLEQSLPLIQAFSYGWMLVLLYLQLRWSPHVRESAYARRLVAFGLFLAAVQFPVLWIFPWERPETLPTALYLAAVTFLAVRSERVPLIPGMVAMMLLSVGQALARGDAPVVAGAGIVLCAALSTGLPRARRISMGLLGFVCGAAGGLTQMYLTHRFPLKSPGQTKWTFQLFTNLNLADAPFHTPILLTALLPLLATVVLIRRYRIGLDLTDKLALVMCMLDLPVYVTMGLVSEVRIYVPYLFLAAPLMAKVWMQFLFGGTNAPGPASPLESAEPAPARALA